MKVIILVAGYATRLYPLTLNMPKALLPINDKPIIDYIIDKVNELSNVDNIYVVSNHKFAAQFEAWANEKNNSIPIKVLDDGTTTEETRKGAIGDIFYTIEQESIDDDLIVIAGDNFFTYKLTDYYNYFKNIDHDCVCIKSHNNKEELKQLGIAIIDKNNKLIEFEEKPQHPKSNNVVYATYIYKKETLPLFKKYLDSGNKPDAPGYFVQWLCKEKDVFAYNMNGDCYDIGTPEAYKEIQKMLK